MSLVSPTTTGLSSPGDGAAAASASDQYLDPASFSEIGSSGKIADGGSNVINLSIDNGQAAATTSQGLSGLIGAGLYDLGSTITGAVNLAIEITGSVNQSYLCVGVFRATSAPTTLQGIEDATAQYLQVKIGASGQVNTYLKSGTASLTSGNAENKSSSTLLEYAVGMGASGFGPSMSRHEHDTTHTVRTSTTDVNTSSGNVYVFVAWGKSATAASAETLGVKIRGGMPQ